MRTKSQFVVAWLLSIFSNIVYSQLKFSSGRNGVSRKRYREIDVFSADPVLDDFAASDYADTRWLVTLSSAALRPLIVASYCPAGDGIAFHVRTNSDHFESATNRASFARVNRSSDSHCDNIY